MNRRILLSGLPGAMASEVAQLIEDSGAFAPVALSGARHDGQPCEINGHRFALLGPESRERIDPMGLLAIDFSTPGAMLGNAEWFCARGIPFVMGTTGGDLAAVEACARASSTCAVIAPNMAIPIVLLLAAAEHLAAEYPGVLAGHRVAITESHQATKRDTSGTAKAMVTHLCRLGLDASVERIEKLRDPARQRALGVPEEHLGGHAFHRYELRDSANTVRVALHHDVMGRRVYAEGAMAAARFLETQFDGGVRGKCFSMRDVLRGP